MMDRIANRSYAEGFRRSRLPSFTSEEVNLLRGSADYLGLNHYSSQEAYYIDEPTIGEPNYNDDLGTGGGRRPTVSGLIIIEFCVVTKVLEDGSRWIKTTP